MTNKDTVSYIMRPSGKSPVPLWKKDFGLMRGRYVLNDTIEIVPTGRQYKLLGDEIPYNVSSDNVITGVLVGCFLLVMLALSFSRGFITRQFSSFFSIRRRQSAVVDTDHGMGVQYLFVVQLSAVLGVFFYVFSSQWLGNVYRTDYQFLTVGVFSAIFLAYFLAKKVFYEVVDWVFFDRKRNERWSRSFLFLTSVEAVLMFPVVMLQIYLNIQLKAAVLVLLVVAVLVKLLSFYKTNQIFFNIKGGFVQNILYFCALEAMPLVALSGILLLTGNYLKINF